MQKAAADSRLSQLLPVSVLPAAAPPGDANPTAAAADGGYIRIRRHPSNSLDLLQKDPHLVWLLKLLALLRVGQVGVSSTMRLLACGRVRSIRSIEASRILHQLLTLIMQAPGSLPPVHHCHGRQPTSVLQNTPFLSLPSCLCPYPPTRPQIPCTVAFLVLCAVALGARQHIMQAGAVEEQQEPAGGTSPNPNSWQLRGQDRPAELVAHYMVRGWFPGLSRLPT